jgi:hypothetical protein
MKVFQYIDGKRKLPEELCLTHAARVFRERRNADTGPKIVQMVLRNMIQDHWYYRSNEWVDQPYFSLDIGLQPYVGPANLAPPHIYGKGTFNIDEELTMLLQ